MSEQMEKLIEEMVNELEEVSNYTLKTAYLREIAEW